MREVVADAAFKRDVKKLRGKDMDKLKSLIRLLAEGLPLPARYRDHSLGGPE